MMHAHLAGRRTRRAGFITTMVAWWPGLRAPQPMGHLIIAVEVHCVLGRLRGAGRERSQGDIFPSLWTDYVDRYLNSIEAEAKQ